MRNAVTLAFALAACQSPPASAPVMSSTSSPVTTSPSNSEEHPVGFRLFDGVDPVSGVAMPMTLFYPAATGALDARTQIGPYPIAGSKDAPIQTGRYPLVAISHGHGGTNLGHHDLASALARHGYVVVTMEHIGDSYRDTSGARTARVALGRANQVSSAIDAALADPAVGPHVDKDKIGVAGFSMGGWTSLLVVGAKPTFARFGEYCQRHPDDKEMCGEAIEISSPPQKPTHDPRVKAAFAMAPLAIPFGPDAFTTVTAPIYLYWATEDHLLLPDENAKNVMAAPSLRGKTPIAGADHYVFLAPCTAAMAKHAGEICTDPPGIDREAWHTKMDADAVGFFDRELHHR